jgi:RNA polymerase-binding transcription factor DksA
MATSARSSSSSGSAKKAAAKKTTAKKTAAKSSSTGAKSPAPKSSSAGRSGRAGGTRSAGTTNASKASGAKASGSRSAAKSKPSTVSIDGVSYRIQPSSTFDAAFLESQLRLLIEERVALTGQATRLEDEANMLIEDHEMGDVQFDDESGEGDTMVVERERDLALSAQARQTVAEIDTAIDRIASGTYGFSSVSGDPIPAERLEAIPWATMLVHEKAGGIGRR